MAKFYTVEQGSADWYKLRLGIPTASQFHRIATSTGKLSKQARNYAFFLVAERLLNECLEPELRAEWMERGRELEPQAMMLYEFENDVQTGPGGFVTNDAGTIGASPDRLIGSGHAALELKCPAPQTHVKYMLEGPGEDYKPQVQGQLLIGEFHYVDFYSYHPAMPPVFVRTYRDEKYIEILKSALDEFVDMKEDMLEKARTRGLFAERARVMTPYDRMAEEDDPFGLPTLEGFS
jgi:hypothetical protein